MGKRMETVIEARNIVKSFQIKAKPYGLIQDIFFPQYKTIKALDDASIEVKKGEIFGLLGPNGSGKSTLIKCITGLMRPDSGSIYLFGKYPEEAKARIGVMFGNSLLYNRLTGYDNLKFYAKLYGTKKYHEIIPELAKKFGIEKHINTYVENYSLGAKTRLAFARAIIHDPEILFLDEPTIGLDPIIASSIRKTIKGLKKTVFVTTHYMDEADELCDRIAIISNGKIIGTGTPEQLKKTMEENTIVIAKASFNEEKLLGELKKSEFVVDAFETKNGIKIIVRHKKDLSELLKTLGKYNIVKVTEQETSLEDVFVKLAGDSIGN